MAELALTDVLFEDTPAEAEYEKRIASVRVLWERAASSHMVVGTACSCGLPAMHISVADFERDLADYLRDKWSEEKRAVELMDGVSGKIGALIDGLAREAVPAEIARSLLDDLETAIRSFGPPVGPAAAQGVS